MDEGVANRMRGKEEVVSTDCREGTDILIRSDVFLAVHPGVPSDAVASQGRILNVVPSR